MNRLKELRNQRKLTLDDIETKTGIKRDTYSNYENNKTEPKLATWQKLADFYQVPVGYVQGISDNKKRKAFLITVDSTNYCDLVFAGDESCGEEIQDKFLGGDSVFEICKHDKTIKKPQVMVWRDKNLDGVENCEFFKELKLRNRSVLVSKLKG